VVGAGWCLTSLCLDRRDARFWLLLAGITIVLVLFKPTRGALSFSKQADPIILFLLSAAALAFVRRRDGWVALCLGLAIALKPFVVVVTLLLLWKGAYRAFVGTGIVAGVLVLAPLLGLGLLQDYVTVTSFYAGPLIGATPLSQSTYALPLRTLTVQPYTVPLVNVPWLVEPLRLSIGVGLLVGLGVAVSRSRERPPLVQAVEWGLVVTAMLIFGPLTEEQHLSYLPIGLVAVLALTLPAWDTSAGARRIVVATAALVLFFLLPGTQDIAWGFYAYERGPIPPPFSFTTFLFLYALLAVGAVEVATLRWLSRRPV